MQSWEEDCPLQIHYVAQAFWAWKGGERKLKNLSNFLDNVLCILPFEEEVLRRHGLAATFVGHPTLEDNLLLKSVPIEMHKFHFLIMYPCIISLEVCVFHINISPLNGRITDLE